MKQHRLFIAINFPEEIKKKLLSIQEQWSEFPIRWTRKENLHLTLIFIGYVGEQELYEICKANQETVAVHEPFILTFNRVCLGPPGKEPRMVWVEGEESQPLADLNRALEEKIFRQAASRPVPANRQQAKTFRPHITLGRIRQGDWRELPEKPNINEQISWHVEICSVEVMESVLKPAGPDYFVLESVSLGEPIENKIG